MTGKQKPDSILQLWPRGIPGSIEDPDYQECLVRPWGQDCPGQITRPRLEIWLPENSGPAIPFVMICPGGGYEALSNVNEGTEPARWLNSLGIGAGILMYRLPSPRIMSDPSTGPLADAREAMGLIRSKAKEWHLDSRRIGVMGFSAGGHLAACLSAMPEPSHEELLLSEVPEIKRRPDFSILIYPVIGLEDSLMHGGSRQSLLGSHPGKDKIKDFSPQYHIGPQTPPAFLVHSTDDGAVPWRNSLAWLEGLEKAGIPAEVHLYPQGGHGYGLGRAMSGKDFPLLEALQPGQASHCAWPDACAAWLARR